MFDHDIDKIMNEIKEESEKTDHFIKRTAMHVDLVRKAITKILAVYPDEFPGLHSQGASHDKSKFKEPELTPYIALTWAKKIGDKTSSSEFDAATLHHVKNNSHHPEFHSDDEANISKDNRDASDRCIDATKMPPTDVAECVADWWAMSQELKTNTARQWYDKVRDVRWHFSDEQNKLIDRLLKVFEKEPNV